MFTKNRWNKSKKNAISKNKYIYIYKCPNFFSSKGTRKKKKHEKLLIMPNVPMGYFILLVLLSGHIKRFSVSCMRDVCSQTLMVCYILYLVQVFYITNAINKSSLHSHIIMHSFKMKLPYF